VHALRRHLGRSRLGSAQVVAPRFGRLLTWTLAAGAANDFLQTAFVSLDRKSEELAERV
jgi:hypothetical protein